MWDLLDILFDVALGVRDPISSWRFYVSLLLTLALVGGVFWLVSDSAVASILSVPVVVVGLILGFVWERSA